MLVFLSEFRLHLFSLFTVFTAVSTEFNIFVVIQGFPVMHKKFLFSI